jgi:ABC-type Fe3+ transport system substrate-binding protein
VETVAVFTAAAFRDTRNADAARRLIGFLASAEMAPVLEAAGLEPIGPKG